MNMNDFNQEDRIHGRSVLITGGTTGIGRAIALKLATLGAKVFITGHDETHLQDALEDWRQINREGALNGIVADLSTEEGINTLFNEADQYFDNRLDVLINNAALASQSVMEANYAEWERVIRTNLLGYLACAHQAIERMLINKTGHIINIGSMSADVRERGSSVYVASKSGIQGFSESLRKEVNEKGIKVTLIEPGAVDTDMQPKSTEEKHDATENLEMLQADDIAAAVLYVINQPERCDVVDIKLRPHLQLI
jgi:NADP-dependent 3-hydroxy acid dehydrogenase YdfG